MVDQHRCLGGTRTANLLIRRPFRRVRVVVSTAVVAGQVGCVFQQVAANPGPCWAVDGQSECQVSGLSAALARARLRSVVVVASAVDQRLADQCALHRRAGRGRSP